MTDRAILEGVLIVVDTVDDFIKLIPGKMRPPGRAGVKEPIYPTISRKEENLGNCRRPELKIRYDARVRGTE